MSRKLKAGRGAKLWKKAKTLIPGGNQLLSKRAEMFLPDLWPAYYKKAKGVRVWDLDGKRYFDMSIMGIGACVLGYANEGVNRAVKKAADNGNASTLNCPEEVELAEKLIAIHPWAGMARFARTGGEACSIAVRIARAASKKDKVAFCGYHGWSDWYLSANLGSSTNLDGQLLPGLEPAGVPRTLKNTAFPFSFGKLDELEAIFKKNKGRIGVVITEVRRHKEDTAFLRGIRRLADKYGAVLIFDETSSGFRLKAGGLHTPSGVEPDLLVLGKAMGNGYPISAVIGRKRVMAHAQDTFISSTHWSERVGFAAALEVIRQFQKEKAAVRLIQTGRYISKRLREIIARSGLNIDIVGLDSVPTMVLREPEPLVLKTYFTQEMLKRGFLASTIIYVSTAHTKQIVDRYMKNAAEVFAQMAKLGAAGVKKRLEGPVCHSGFKRLA